MQLLNAGWIGVVPVKKGSGGDGDGGGGLVPKNYLQLPETYVEGSVSAAAAPAPGGENEIDDDTSEYETETETEKEEEEGRQDLDLDKLEAREVEEQEVATARDEQQEQDEEEGKQPSMTSSSEYESESEEEEDEQGNQLNDTMSSIHSVKNDEEREIVKERILHIYRQHNPRKMADVVALLDDWKGEERLLLAKIGEPQLI